MREHAAVRLLTLVLLVCAALFPLEARAECEEDDRVEECEESSCVGQIFVEIDSLHSIDETLTDFPQLFLVDAIPARRFYLLGVTVPQGQEVDEIVDGLVHDLKDAEGTLGILRVEPHRHLEAPESVQLSLPDLGVTAEPQDYENQPASSAVQTEAAQGRYTGSGAVVAVIDTGVELDHPILAGHVVLPGVDVIGGSGSGAVQHNDVDDDGDGKVDEALHHGTFVAGLVHLVSPNARILPIRALEEDGKGTAFGVARAIYRAIDLGADVINLSIGMLHGSRPIEKAIEDAVDAGIVVVAAAGNRGEPWVDAALDNSDECMSFPAADTGAIAVAAVDPSLVKAAFSDYGPDVDLSAPGVDLLSTDAQGGFSAWSGTSFAAPLVAGGAALILEKYPCLSPDEVRGLLMQTAQPDNNPGLSGLMGDGVLDLDALTAALTADRCSLRLEEGAGGTVARWSPVLGASSYDLVRGSVGALSAGAGMIDLGAVSCLVSDSPITDSATAPDALLPAAGEILFYLFRDDLDSSYGTGTNGAPRLPASGDCAAAP